MENKNHSVILRALIYLQRVIFISFWSTFKGPLGTNIDLNKVHKYVIVFEVAIWKTVKPDPKERAVPEKLLKNFSKIKTLWLSSVNEVELLTQTITPAYIPNATSRPQISSRPVFFLLRGEEHQQLFPRLLSDFSDEFLGFCDVTDLQSVLWASQQPLLMQ